MRKATLLGAIAGALGLGLGRVRRWQLRLEAGRCRESPRRWLRRSTVGCFWHHGYWHRRRHHHRFRAGFFFSPFIGFGFHRHHFHRRLWR
jgi:hypothetical protein